MTTHEPASPRSALARRFGFWAGIAVFVLVLLLEPVLGGEPAIVRMAAIAALMATWWITDAIPLAATSLVPLVLYPLLGIMSGKDLAPVYVNYIIFLFLGGFLIALAMERWNLHRRIALTIVRAIGSRPERLVLGFMVATAFLSMWISNTATAIMMLAIGLAVIRAEEENFGEQRVANLSVALLLGIAYSASVGGIATLVGTPPNLTLVRIFELSFPEAAESGFSLSFGQWMLLGVPLSLILLAIVWFLLTRVFFRSADDLALSRDTIDREYTRLGPMRFEEGVVLAVFSTTALLWVFRKKLTLGEFSIPGWSSLLPTGVNIDDGTVAIAMALVLFLVPARNRDVSGGGKNDYGTILDFGVFAKVPWHIILLFGGGFALAKGFQVSGLSAWVGGAFEGLQGTPAWIMVATICAILTFLTELTSNTATTEMVLPLLASIATAAKLHPLLLMIPAALSASCAFMMPVATPPNAIIFGSGRVRIAQMVRVGIVINLIGITVITAVFLLLGPLVFGIEWSELPEWATEASAEEIE